MELINEIFLFIICNSFICYSVSLPALKHNDFKFSEYLEETSFNGTNYDLSKYIFVRQQEIAQKTEIDQPVKKFNISGDLGLMMEV